MALTFQPNSVFRTEVERAVAAYFESTGLSERDVPRMYLKTLTMFLWLSASYVGLVFFASGFWSALPFSVSLGLAMAGIGFSVQHDGGHGAYSEHKFVNRCMAWSLDILGGSSYFWHFKHNIAHHTYPNITGADDDLVVGAIGRLSPYDPWRAPFRFQHVYLWFLYGLLPIRWQLMDDFHSMIDPGIGQTKVTRPSGWNLVRFWLGKATFCTWAFVLPMSRHSVASVLLFYVITQFVLGIVLATVFQMAHCVEEATFPMPGEDGRMQRDWATHQVYTTVDFAHGNRLLTWYVGGLNYQVEHHLFPRICHIHYPALAPIVERVALSQGIPYRNNRRLSDALRSHYRWLRRMGSEQAAPAMEQAS